MKDSDESKNKCKEIYLEVKSQEFEVEKIVLETGKEYKIIVTLDEFIFSF